MPKRKNTGSYQRIKMRPTRRREFLDERDLAVREIYARALPEHQEYPPTLRGELKPTAKPYNRSREQARRVRQTFGAPQYAAA